MTRKLMSAAIGAALLTGATQLLQAAPKTKKSGRNHMMPARNAALKIHDVKVGKGAVARPGMMVTVHYRGTLTNGKQFDASRDRGQPFTFTLGAGEVIKGWDQGVAGMKVGGKRRLRIPPQLGYGSRAMGTDIPANSTLIFEVDLLKVARQ